MARGFDTPSGGGVFLFTNEGWALEPDLLVSHAQALAVLLTDLDGDGRRDSWSAMTFVTPSKAGCAAAPRHGRHRIQHRHARLQTVCLSVYPLAEEI